MLFLLGAGGGKIWSYAIEANMFLCYNYNDDHAIRVATVVQTYHYRNEIFYLPENGNNDG